MTDTIVAPRTEATGFVKEGLASIRVDVVDSNNVFYNPAQVFNRDLSIVAIRAFAEVLNEEYAAKRLARASKSVSAEGKKADFQQDPAKLRILEPLAATGLRSIRYALELKDVLEVVVAGDLDPDAVRCIEKNRRENGVDPDTLKAVCSDANQIMHVSRFAGCQGCFSFSLSDASPSADARIDVPFYRNRTTDNCFHVIDLDPYGSVASFLDAAVCAVADGGLLCLTSTDMPILCGNNPEVSFYKYGGTALKAAYMHEMSLRLLINAVAVAAARHKRVVEPLVCCSVDFYIRCFVRIRTSPYGCKRLATQTSLVFQCCGCNAFSVTPLGHCVGGKDKAPERFKSPQISPATGKHVAQCQECGKEGVFIGGPFYSAPTFDAHFVKQCLRFVNDEVTLPGLTMRKKIRGVLTAISEELPDVPLHYNLPALMSSIKTETMKLTEFKSALLHLGYRVSHFHRDPQAVKTDAPNSAVFDILRKWAEDHPPKEKEKHAVLMKPVTTLKSIEFTLHPCAVQSSVNVARWLPNPAPHWGPKKRAKNTGGGSQPPQKIISLNK